MNKPPLFRAAVLEGQPERALGRVLMARPLAFSVLAGASAAAALAVLLFLAFGTYTKRSTVSGQLVPEVGLIKIHPQQGGIVLQKYAHEGQQVRRGQVLFVLSSERQSASEGATQANISGRIAARGASLQEELRQTERLQQEARSGAAKRVAALQNELDNIVSQLEGQASRVQLAEEAHARAQELVARNFVSREQVQQKLADLLDQRNRQRALEREKIALGRELNDQRIELDSLPLRNRNTAAQLQRGINSAGQELTESEAKRELQVLAPEDGVLTAVALERGQSADPGMPMASLIPRGAGLIAELHVPSRAVGFVRTGSAVLLRYQAYPYQKFGHGSGTVIAVSRTALSPAELGQAGAGGESLYRITVRLRAQSVQAYGHAEALQSGMLLEADVLQDTRRLYEWVLEPLYSLTGKL